MKARYDDLIARLGRPDWWDENGVPRYGPFEPAHCGNPYAFQAALIRACCCFCRRETDLAISSDRLDLDIRMDLAARGMAIYGLLPHFEHCGRPNNGELRAVRSVWQRPRPETWDEVFKGE